MIEAISPTDTGRAESPSAPAELGREEFLRLFLTQLKAQDPLEPMKSEDFTAQLAQFSSLEQMFNSNEALRRLVDLQNASTALSATSLLGRRVLAEGNAVRFDGQRPVDLIYGLKEQAAGVTVTVFDESGEAVAALRAPEDEGEHVVAWDGRDRDGNLLPAGTYTFTVTAFDALGDEVASWSRTVGTVDGVRFDGGVPYVRVNGRELPLEAVRQIENQGI